MVHGPEQASHLSTSPVNSSAVVFDFDGVLADSAEVTYRTLCKIAERRGVDPPSVEFLRTQAPHEIMRALRLSWWTLPYYVSLGRRLLAQERAQGLGLFPWAEDLLVVAGSLAPHVQILSSNGEGMIRKTLGPLARHVSSIQGSVGMLSKHRQLRKVARSLGVTPSRLIYIGDESRDILAARKAGVRSLAVGWGFQDSALLRKSGADSVAETWDSFGEKLASLLPRE
jgi:phosphoglycolate phosphatase